MVSNFRRVHWDYFPRDEYQKGQFLRSNRKFRGGSALRLKKRRVFYPKDLSVPVC